MKTGVSRDKLNANIPSVGYGYVFIPENIDRDKYIKSCFRKEKVSIFLDQGGSTIFDCYITKQILQDIVFPEDSEKLGSMVVFVSMDFNNKPIIIGTISKNQESQLLKENFYKFLKSNDGSIASISIDGNGVINLVVNGDDSKIKLDVIGEGGELEMNSSGVIKLNSNSDIEFNSTSKVQHSFIDNEGVKEVKLYISNEGLKYEDQSGNVFEINKNEGKIKLFNGGSPIPLGNNLKTQLDKNNSYLNQLQAAISTALSTLDALGIPVSTTFNTTMSSAVKGDFSKINSQKSFID